MKGDTVYKANGSLRILSAVVITVGVQPEFAGRLVELARKMHWEVTASNFDTYISAVRRPSLGSEMKSADLCLAVIDFDGQPEQAAETAQYLTHAFPGRMTIIALAKSDDPAMLLSAMRAGCSEFLYKPLDEPAVNKMLSRLAELWSTSGPEHAGSGTVISFLGVKGGVGATTLASHLAMYLAQCHGKRTLLIDSRPELGHVCVYLGLQGNRYHFQELVRNVSRLDSELLQGFVAKHPHGLDVLSSPDVLGAGKAMDPEAVTKTLEFLRSEYDYVVLDCCLPFNEITVASLAASSRVYLVASPAFGAIRDLSRSVDKLAELGGPADRVQVVVNRNTGLHGLSIEQIEKAIRMPVTFNIAESEAGLLQATNLGETLSPKSKAEFVTQLVKWTESLVGTSEAPPAVVKKEKRPFSLWHRVIVQQDS